MPHNILCLTKFEVVFFCAALFLAIICTLCRNYKGIDTANLRYMLTFVLDVFGIGKQMVNHQCGLEWALISKQVTYIKSHNVLSYSHKDCRKKFQKVQVIICYKTIKDFEKELKRLLPIKTKCTNIHFKL